MSFCWWNHEVLSYFGRWKKRQIREVSSLSLLKYSPIYEQCDPLYFNASGNYGSVETFIRASLHDETWIEMGPSKKKTAIIWTLRRWLRSEMLAVHQHYLKGFQPLYNHQRKCCNWWVFSENKKSRKFTVHHRRKWTVRQSQKWTILGP